MRTKATTLMLHREAAAYGSRIALAEPVIGRRFAPTRWLACPGRRINNMHLRQPRLQIEAHIRRLFRSDRAAHAKDLASEHVIGGAVDRFDADELAGLVAERRERPLL